MASAYGNGIVKFFKEGAEVEINSTDEGFNGSWYPGTVIRLPGNVSNSSSKVLVEYKTLMEDEKGTRRLRERIDLIQLRPPPPSEGRRSFNVSEDVDVYYNEGWWEGRVTEVVMDNEYEVFFRGTREKMVFKVSKLRLHREWVQGKWFPPLEQPYGHASKKAPLSAEVQPEKERIELNFTPGERVEVSSDEDGLEGAWFAGIVVTKLSPRKYLIEYESLMNDDNTLLMEKVDSVHIRPYPPEIPVVDGYNRLEEVDARYNDAWWVGVISKVLKNDQYGVYFWTFDEELKFKHSELRVHQDWINGKWIVA